MLPLLLNLGFLQARCSRALLAQRSYLRRLFDVLYTLKKSPNVDLKFTDTIDAPATLNPWLITRRPPSAVIPVHYRRLALAFASAAFLRLRAVQQTFLLLVSLSFRLTVLALGSVVSGSPALFSSTLYDIHHAYFTRSTLGLRLFAQGHSHLAFIYFLAQL